MINQRCNFGKTIVFEVCDEALKRKLISIEKLKSTLKNNEVIRIKKKEVQENFDIEPKSVEFEKRSFFYYWFNRMVSSLFDSRYKTISPTERYDLSKRRIFKRHYSNDD
jgi:hypothetical protein